MFLFHKVFTTELYGYTVVYNKNKRSETRVRGWVKDEYVDKGASLKKGEKFILSYDGGGGTYVPPFFCFFCTKNLSPRPNP